MGSEWQCLLDGERKGSMKVIIVSAGNPARMKAQRFIATSSYEWNYVFARGRAVDVPGAICHEMDVPEDLNRQCRPAFKRDWAERNLTSQGEWYLSIDDNVHDITMVPEPWMSLDKIDFDGEDWLLDEEKFKTFGYEWRKVLNVPIKRFTDFESVVENMVSRMESMGTVYGGFAIENNYYFRNRKWQGLGYVRTSLAVIKNVGLPFYYWPENMFEDFTRSVDVVARYGSVLINRFVKAEKTPFEAGGIGTLEDRIPLLTAVCAKLLEMYPGLLRESKNRPYQLQFAKTLKTIRQWREENGYL